MVWSNGGDRSVKFDHDSFDVLAEYPLDEDKLVADVTAGEAIARLDTLEGRPLLDLGMELAMTYLLGLGGVCYDHRTRKRSGDRGRLN